MAEKRGGLRYSARLQVCSHPVGVGSVAGTGGVAVGCAAGHRRGVCILALALPLTVRNQELSGGFMDLIKRAIKDMAHSAGSFLMAGKRHSKVRGAAK